MRLSLTVLIVAGAAAFATPALAITKQQPPTLPVGQHAQIADPDARHDDLANRIDRAAKRRAYDRSSARSVLEIGSRAPAGS